MESGSSYCFYLGLSIANSSCSFFFNQLVCCGSWFKFTWQLQAKLTAHSWCWEHFCDVETILTHPTDYSWSPPNFRQPKTSVSSAKWWHQAYDYHHHHNLLAQKMLAMLLLITASGNVDRFSDSLSIASGSGKLTRGNVTWLQQSFNLRKNFSRICAVDFLVNLSLINFTSIGIWKIALELK